ncbi:MAG: hypothetical protein SLAVMIC_00819 [uncultured marine phage]|uniref:Uncharacterized protein n=1 Tax=uncultured marine phage TaxID=707152 RepID=A0A8D9CC77_9VIRU|nr:MAG: hypothetical protein SLAVMIC_00819 [uncultured marine phage]
MIQRVFKRINNFKYHKLDHGYMISISKKNYNFDKWGLCTLGILLGVLLGIII